MRSIVVILTFLGIMSIVVGYVKQSKNCPPPEIRYRYVPRTFEEEQQNPVKPSELFNSMFTEPSPWLGDLHGDKTKHSEANRYFISQSGGLRPPGPP